MDKFYVLTVIEGAFLRMLQQNVNRVKKETF